MRCVLGYTETVGTHHRGWRIIQNSLDFRHNLRGQLRDHLDRFEVIEDLLGFRRAEDDGGCVWVPR